MQFPWVQVTNEVIDVAAAEIAAELGEDELRMLGACNKLIRWAIQRCREDRPPSVQAVVPGAGAARLIFTKAGLPGVDVEAFLRAFCAAGLLEDVEGGVKIKGMRRYDAGWRKNYPSQARIWDEKHPATAPTSGRPRAETGTNGGPNAVGTKSGRNRNDTVPPDADADADADRDTDPPPPPTPSAKTPGAADARPPAGSGGATAIRLAWVAEEEDPRTGRIRDVVRWQPTDDGAWEMIQLIRERYFGLSRELERPAGFLAWFAEWFPRQGSVAMESTVWRYLGDPKIQARGHPTAVLITLAMYESLAVGPDGYTSREDARGLGRA